jgi:DNA-binding Lrp family transcriptional regulator
MASTFDIISKKYLASDKSQETKSPPTKDEILVELESMNINTASIESLSDKVLLELLNGLKNLTSQFYQGRRGRPPKNEAEASQEPPILSNADKKILKSLIASNCNVSSLTLSRELGIPLSTVQRRRKRLEANLIETVYQLKLDRFGWRSATLFVTTANTSARHIGEEMMAWNNEVVSVKRCMGENSADLQIDIVFRTNRELADIIERVKTIDGVTNVTWSESIETIGRNVDFYERILSQS